MPEITFTCSDEDHAWLAEQAQSLGIDDIGITVRVVVRNARQRNQSFGIVANRADPVVYQPRQVHVAPGRTFQTAVASDTADFEPTPIEDAEADEVEAALAEAGEVVSGIEPTPQSAPLAQPSSSFRQRAATFRNTAAPLRVVDGPGSRTNAVAMGDMLASDPRTLAPGDAVVARNFRTDRHFAGVRR